MTEVVQFPAKPKEPVPRTMGSQQPWATTTPRYAEYLGQVGPLHLYFEQHDGLRPQATLVIVRVINGVQIRSTAMQMDDSDDARDHLRNFQSPVKQAMRAAWDVASADQRVAPLSDHATADPFDVATKAVDALLTAMEINPDPVTRGAYLAAIRRHGEYLVEAAGKDVLHRAVLRIQVGALNDETMQQRDLTVSEAWKGLDQ